MQVVHVNPLKDTRLGLALGLVVCVELIVLFHTYYTCTRYQATDYWELHYTKCCQYKTPKDIRISTVLYNFIPL